MSNHITIELCAEDRARLDKLTAALERRACEKCVETALAAMNAAQHPIAQPLADVLAEAESPTGATEAETPATIQEAAAGGEAPPVVTVDDIRQRYVALVASGKKDEARDMIKSYNVSKISDIPADKCEEVLAKLNALEEVNKK